MIAHVGERGGRRAKEAVAVVQRSSDGGVVACARPPLEETEALGDKHPVYWLRSRYWMRARCWMPDASFSGCFVMTCFVCKSWAVVVKCCEVG